MDVIVYRDDLIVSSIYKPREQLACSDLRGAAHETVYTARRIVFWENGQTWVLKDRDGGLR